MKDKSEIGLVIIIRFNSTKTQKSRNPYILRFSTHIKTNRNRRNGNSNMHDLNDSMHDCFNDNIQGLLKKERDDHFVPLYRGF